MDAVPSFTAKKDYFEPMHTAEHILNQTMVRMFGCGRSQNAHIEKSKSKCDFALSSAPAPADMQELERRVNEVIAADLPVTCKVLPRQEAQKVADLSKLPPTAGDSLRMVYIGDYDVCPCIGKHVENTAQIGRFKLASWEYVSGRLRIRFKLEHN